MDETQVFNNARHERRSPHRLPPALHLLIVGEGRLVEVDRPVFIVGRHSRADLRLAGAEVSRRHCRIACRDGAWHLSDLDSLNGVVVNGERVREAVLRPGDTIRLGGVALRVAEAPAGEGAGDPRAEMLKRIVEALPRRT